MIADRYSLDSQAFDRYRERYRELASRIAQISFMWPGSIHTRYLTCGRPDCECAKDPQARHGPYVYWTSKDKGRSVAKLLHSPEGEILGEWVKNRQEVDRIIQEMKKLSQRALKIALRLRMRETKK